jgi:hypothetical protein
MTRCICAVCGREVNGRIPAKGYGDNVVPYRHLPPEVIKAGAGYTHEPGAGWMGHGRWCLGSFQAAKRVL